MPQKDEYRLAFEIRDEKAHVIVYEPIIDKDERDRRMKALKDAVHDFWVAYYRQQARKSREEKGEQNGRMGQRTPRCHHLQCN